MSIETLGGSFPEEPIRGGQSYHWDGNGVLQSGPNPNIGVWHRSSFGLAIESLREAFETAVADTIGPSLYFNLIHGRVIGNLNTERYKRFQNHEDQNSIQISGPTPVYSETLTAARASSGFNRLNGSLKLLGYKADLTADTARVKPYPCLSLEISPL